MKIVLNTSLIGVFIYLFTLMPTNADEVEHKLNLDTNVPFKEYGGKRYIVVQKDALVTFTVTTTPDVYSFTWYLDNGDPPTWSRKPGQMVAMINYRSAAEGKANAVKFTSKRKEVQDDESEIDCILEDHRTCAVIVPKFITPAGDPVSAPKDSGDGQNEFTFDDSTPGELTIEFKVEIQPADGGGPTLSQMESDFKFEVDSIGSSALTWETGSGYDNGKPKAQGNYLTAKAVFTNLPSSNSGFGKKKVELKYNDGEDIRVVAEAEFEVFYDKVATNHPGAGSGTTPNWYYYWAGTAVTGYDITSGTYSYAPGGPDDYALYSPPPSSPHYTIRGPASAGHESYSTPAAGLAVDRKGIDTLAATLKHEKTHRQVDLNWMPGGIWHGKLDNDSDELPDEWEDANASLGFDKNNRFSFAGSFPYGDDEEVYCELQASGSTGDSTKDWANPGKQSKTAF